MQPDIVPLAVGLLVLVSSLISLRLGLSVAIIEIVLGAIAGNLGMETEEWMVYLATFGGVLLTFLAGTEIDTKILRERFSASSARSGCARTSSRSPNRASRSTSPVSTAAAA